MPKSRNRFIMGFFFTSSFRERFADWTAVLLLSPKCASRIALFSRSVVSRDFPLRGRSLVLSVYLTRLWREIVDWDTPKRLAITQCDKTSINYVKARPLVVISPKRACLCFKSSETKTEKKTNCPSLTTTFSSFCSLPLSIRLKLLIFVKKPRNQYKRSYEWLIFVTSKNI